ncbi:rRNA (cytosine-C5-)-methyltransferase nop2 [Ophidiomyces ophidiicola]|nr:rRNA (cytosine-C5-)-methyltransferase nop2 [Ophidiomyces ophidiicola]KAI1980349.1 rRNA (cytosine-C5-)-methyltransferase nop2 [Ophidiomyces ophidiicola]KAI1986031.1 rRNA (cytosine-C5-)-methyltransferase nop2 [Ophidiomyces ophidiicola]KAI2000959.1 rRNA (cytosine-C5-)-methyltransferase nop2 [Ophidiomyces ophidiicola]
MGVGRRMKKQGPPPPLDESKISSLKRRKAEQEDAAPRGNKRRKAEGSVEVKKSQGRKANGTAMAKNGSEKREMSAKKKQKKDTIPTKTSAIVSKELEISDDDAEGLMADEFDDLENISADGVSDENNEDSSTNESDSVFDSEEDNTRKAMFSDDEDVSDAEEKLTAANIEGLSRKLDKQQREEAELAEQEIKDSAMQTNIEGDRPDLFGEETQHNLPPGLAPDLQLLRTRITDTIRVLGDLSTLGQPGKSRADYTDLLLRDICTYYGYTPYLAEKLYSLFTPMEAFAFFEANESPRPVVIRTNSLRTNRRSLAQALINRGVVLEPVGKWSKVGLQVFESPVPLGATPEYLAGHYILQAASSFLPVMALAPQPHERILDMAAAPGGKTTYMSALMRNTGCVLANDANKERAKGLIGNIHRLGCKNTIVSNLDARTAFPKALGGFDRVLLDAPCSGTGVISKDPSVKTSKTERDFLALPHTQKLLLLAAIDSTNHASKTGGFIVYSTCSVTVEENEAVVQYVLRKRPNVRIVDTGLGTFGSEGFKSYKGKQFDAKMSMTRRYFPHRENVDGFYVCKLKKFGPSPAEAKGPTVEKTAGEGHEAHVEYDKTPIVDQNDKQTDAGFGPFDDDEDKSYIERSERNRIRRKGLDPKAVLDGKRGKKDEQRSKHQASGDEKKPKQKGKKNSAKAM